MITKNLIKKETKKIFILLKEVLSTAIRRLLKKLTNLSSRKNEKITKQKIEGAKESPLTSVLKLLVILFSKANEINHTLKGKIKITQLNKNNLKSGILPNEIRTKLFITYNSTIKGTKIIGISK